MKVKTSVTLSEGLLEAIERWSPRHKNRSDFIETASWRHIRQLAKDEQSARDLEIINRRAGRLNREAEDVLAFQGE